MQLNEYQKLAEETVGYPKPLDKLADRARRGTLAGAGDNR